MTMQIRIIMSIAIACCLFAAGFTVEGWRKNAQIAAMRADFATDMKTLSDAATAASEDARKKERGLLDRVSAIDQRRIKEIENEKLENDRLRAAVDGAFVQLRIQASCPADDAGVPGTTTAASLAHGRAVELAPGARAAYFDLKAGIERDQQIIRGLQEYVRAITSPTP